VDLKLTGKRALVTGSSSGLGEAIAKLLAAEGASVIVHGRDTARASAVAHTIEHDGGSCEIVLGGLDTDAGAEEVAAAALAEGPVDILVNNVGVFAQTSWVDTESADWARIYNVNVLSSVRLIRCLIPQMRERRWGRVIQIGSAAGNVARAILPDYNASCAARESLALSLARELRESGVTSNLVAPGGMLTAPMQEMMTAFGRASGMGDTWEEMESQVVRAMVPNDVGRVARPEEIAAAVVYLASPIADIITGTVLRVDGNWYSQ
jgi:NAD(P)-dependent dehydrogenase (short-subunit alcohol dehydrogenase family)